MHIAAINPLALDEADLDPALNPGARYWIEGQYIAADDAMAGNDDNNVSYREIDVFGSGTFFDINLTGETQRMLPALFAWLRADAGVARTET